jgi:hypothetical protein
VYLAWSQSCGALVKSLGREVAMSSKCRGKISPHKSASVYETVLGMSLVLDLGSQDPILGGQ